MKALSLIFLTALLSLAACSDRPSETGQNPSATPEVASEATATQTKTLENVVNGYLTVKNALVASDAEKTQNAAVALLETVDATEMPLIQQKTKEIAALTNLEEQRTQFDSLSVALYEQLKQHPIEGQTLYKQYCPMAFDNRGAFWLSSDREIKNPYFGDQMLRCGRTEEELTF